MPLEERLEAEEAELLARNLERVRERIARAAESAGRDPEEIRLIAVTKKVPESVIRGLLKLGIRDLGESRPEEIARLRPFFADVADLRWHLIGPYQRKKIAKTLPAVDLVHSAHDLQLLSTLDIRRRQQEPAAPPLPVLIQVNVADEESKQGFHALDAGHAAEMADALTGIDVRGFMTMAPYDADEEELQDIFAELREIRDDLGADRFPELSMGMSGDFEIAVAEGATLVRIGTALFDGLGLSR
jgi:PLP dependent protein